MDAARFARGGLAALLLAGLSGAALGQEPAPGPQPDRQRFRWPLRGAIIQGFQAGANDGIDIAAPIGEPVHAAADGVCIAAGEEIQTYGKLVVIRHDGGYVTVYADNSELEVKEGDKVRRGQIIARSGQSGGAASPRLHFELHRDGQAIDPIKSLVPL